MRKMARSVLGGHGVGSVTGEVAVDSPRVLGQTEVPDQEVPMIAFHLSLLRWRASEPALAMVIQQASSVPKEAGSKSTAW